MEQCFICCSLCDIRLSRAKHRYCPIHYYIGHHYSSAGAGSAGSGTSEGSSTPHCKYRASCRISHATRHNGCARIYVHTVVDCVL